MDNNLWQLYKQVVFWSLTGDLTSCKELNFNFNKNDCALITCDNPNGVSASREQNEAYRQQFDEYLTKEGLNGQLIWGGNKSQTHKELTYVLPIDEANSYLIARRYQQNAFYTIKSGSLYLVASNGRRRECLGAFADFIYVPDKY